MQCCQKSFTRIFFFPYYSPPPLTSPRASQNHWHIGTSSLVVPGWKTSAPWPRGSSTPIGWGKLHISRIWRKNLLTSHDTTWWLASALPSSFPNASTSLDDFPFSSQPRHGVHAARGDGRFKIYSLNRVRCWCTISGVWPPRGLTKDVSVNYCRWCC